MLINSQTTIFTFTQPRYQIFDYESTSVYMNNGIDSYTLSDEEKLFSIFMNSSWQNVYLFKTNYPYVYVDDINGNSHILYDLPSILPGENLTVNLKLKIIEKERKIPNVSMDYSGDLIDIPGDLRSKYCTEKGSWLINDEKLIKLANDILQSKNNTNNVLKIVTSLADWIGNNVLSFSHDIPLYPNETYNAKKGDCDDKANLLITLCRILDIPAYLQIGCLHNSGTEYQTRFNGQLITFQKHISYHGWAVIYIPPWGWLPFDMTLAWSSADPLAGIIKAPTWDTSTILLMNITNSDWAGEGQNNKEAIMNSSLHIYFEDELITQKPVMFSINPYIWIGIVIISVTAIFIFLIRESRYKTGR